MRNIWFVSSLVAAAVAAAVPALAASAALPDANGSAVGFATKVEPAAPVGVNFVDPNGNETSIGQTDASGSGYASLAEASTSGITVKQLRVQVVKCGDVQHIDVMFSVVASSADDGCDRKPAFGWVFGPGKTLAVNLVKGGLVQSGGSAMKMGVFGSLGAGALGLTLAALNGNNAPATNSNVVTSGKSTPTNVPSTTFDWTTVDGEYTGYANTTDSPASQFPPMSTVVVDVNLNSSGSGTITIQCFAGKFTENAAAASAGSSASSITGSGSATVSGNGYTVSVDIAVVNHAATGRITFSRAGVSVTYAITLTQTGASHASN